jgi:hypothetical protein
VDTGKAILRDYIKATVGVEQLGVETGSRCASRFGACPTNVRAGGGVFGIDGAGEPGKLALPRSRPFRALGDIARALGVRLHAEAA